MGQQPLIERYRHRLPVSGQTPVVSMGEGSTPLVPLVRIPELQAVQAYAKLESMNPTGSFKDRGMTLAISKALEAGREAVVCASTGNTSASAAAYAARAGLRCIVALPAGKVAAGKLAQAIVYGAVIAAVQGNFDDALRVVRELAEQYPVELVNSVNPYRLEGQKTAAFEIMEALGEAPDYHFLPVGNAGNITAYWRGYSEWCGLEKKPRMMGFQAAGAAPIVEGRVIERPETIATAIRIGNPVSWKQAEAARDQSGGVIARVTDGEILEAYALLARYEGIFCEPSSAAAVAGLLKCLRTQRLKPGATAVCTLTGHGLKDPDIASQSAPVPQPVAATAAAVAKFAGL
ncbi:MAG: threonine synthase [Deinococcus sp.]|nr:threonine synthase [Deinococcus sp.]